jgi:hypothetical protein
LVDNIKDALNKYWPECIIDYKPNGPKMPYGVLLMLLDKMKKRGATKEELDAVDADWEDRYV